MNIIFRKNLIQDFVDDYYCQKNKPKTQSNTVSRCIFGAALYIYIYSYQYKTDTDDQLKFMLRLAPIIT